MDRCGLKIAGMFFGPLAIAPNANADGLTIADTLGSDLIPLTLSKGQTVWAKQAAPW